MLTILMIILEHAKSNPNSNTSRGIKRRQRCFSPNSRYRNSYSIPFLSLLARAQKIQFAYFLFLTSIISRILHFYGRWCKVMGLRGDRSQAYGKSKLLSPETPPPPAIVREKKLKPRRHLPNTNLLTGRG